MRKAGKNEGEDMDAGEAAMPSADEIGGPGRMRDSTGAGWKPAGSMALPFGPDLFKAEPALPRPPAALQRLMKSLEGRDGRRGARLAAMALQAGITPPAAPMEPPGAESVQAALWMELARENANLRREAARLEERQNSLSRRIQRARTRVQKLRLKLLQRRLGLTPRALRDMPPGDSCRERTAGGCAQASTGGNSPMPIEPGTETGAADAQTEKD